MKNYIPLCNQPQADSLEQHLNLQLKEINNFYNSIQNKKDFEKFYSHEVKKYKQKSLRYICRKSGDNHHV